MPKYSELGIPPGPDDPRPRADSKKGTPFDVRRSPRSERLWNPELDAHFSPAVRRSAWLGLLLLGISTLNTTAASAEQVDARHVKAAFVMNFLKFVEWPSSHVGTPPSPVVVAILGDHELGVVLARTADGQQVNGRPVSVRTVSRANEAVDAHLLFIGASEARNLATTLRTVEAQAVLTVGDTEGFAQAGVVLNLYTFDQRVRMEVNTAAAARARLRLSAHLLRIARIVD